MRKRDKVDRLIGDVLYDFTHVWVDGFGWEPTIMLPSDFDSINKLPKKNDDGSTIFIACNLNDKKEAIEIRKFKGFEDYD